MLSIEGSSNHFNLSSGRNPHQLWKNEMEEIEEDDDKNYEDE